MKNKTGFRKITVEEQIFNWKFAEIIDIRPENNMNNKLEVDFGYYDVWLYVNDKENRPPDFDPKSITPKFVKNAIDYAIINGWNINSKNQKTRLIYRDNMFLIDKYEK